MNKVLVGRVALALTILCLLVALQQNGYWWAATAIFAALTLWGTSDSQNNKNS